MSYVGFDEVISRLQEVLERVEPKLDPAVPIYAIRDLWGRVRFLLPERPSEGDQQEHALASLARLTAEHLGPRAYPPDQASLFGTELLANLDEWETLLPSLLVQEGPPPVRLMDRQVIGLSWASVRETGPEADEAHLVAFYSIKGGVGRSTATAVAAWHLASLGKSVMVLDLDIEAPGLSSSLLPEDHQPRFGIVDWFVEDAVGQGDQVLQSMIARSPLATDLPGDIWVVPSYGTEVGDYIAKLGRCYVDLPREGRVEPWEQRLLRLLSELQDLRTPDVVLLDTRSGLHDIASTAVTEIADRVLLFAIDSRQTWEGYRLLFEYWQRFGAAARIRDRLQIVAALVPETNRESYLSRFTEESWNLFLKYLYDELGEGEIDGFSFDLDDSSAPHHPLPVYWSRGFASLASFGALDPQQVAANYAPFLEGLEQLLGMSEQASGAR